ncbi:restriction endonuclease subunit S [Frankia sp. AgB32]|uniref:restriction endonuclease subunit S n=1 Tax=Frankia sp. AgB32 TaxID=631119 RepID=UPI00200D7FD7|nr:restriction endonuclease subunit S [Frankia sp. AgB32]MCK9894173.1 restriction endonuclease subunit S [Frankia sp. AgB32]
MTWSTVALKRVAQFTAGGTPSVDEPSYWSDGDSGYAWVAIGDMSSVDSVITTTRRVSADGIRASRLKIGEPGTILFSMYASLGHTAWLEVPAAWNQAILGLRVDGNTDSRFLRYALVALRPRLIEQARSNTQANLNAEQVGNLQFSRPPLDEQRRIADFLDAETARIGRLVSQRLRQRELLDELTLSLIDEYIGRPGFVPTVRLGYLAFVQTGVTVDSGRQNDGDVVTLPYLRVANVQVGYVDLSEVAEITVPRKTVATSRLQIGDVLMTEGGDLDKLGRGTVWRGEISECLHQNHVFAVRPDLRVIEPEYLALLTRASRARRYFESTGNKTTNLASTSSSKIRDFRVPLPDLPTQRELVKRIDGRLKAVSELNARLFNQIAALAERRQAVIAAAVTGRLEVATGRELDGAA